ncbi:MAG: imidazole glycerol phosphate synthase subunit HisF [Planctomycetota bacterium]
MLMTRIIPCLDCRDGRVVKGVRFQGLRDAGDPVNQALRYQAQGADELVLLDVSATRRGHGHQVETVRAVRRELGIALTCGGGVRSADDAAELLEAGADKVGINSAAVRDPELVAGLALRFGQQCVVVAIDAARSGESWLVRVAGGSEATEIDAVGWAAEAERLGAGEILLTSYDRDGTRDGYDLELLRAVSSRVRIPVIASGGADSPEHMAAAVAAGAHAVLAASIFHDGVTTVQAVKRRLGELGLAVRSHPTEAAP